MRHISRTFWGYLHLINPDYQNPFATGKLRGGGPQLLSCHSQFLHTIN